MFTLPQARAARRATQDEAGATSTEYGILVSFIAVALVIGVTLFGDAVNTVYVGLSDWVSSTF